MSLPPRPIQLATHNGVQCWLLTPDQLNDGHLGREVVGALLEGTLVGFERTDVHRVTLTLSGTGRIELLDSKQMLVACDPPAPVETIPAARLARELPGCFIAWNDARTRTAWGGVLEKVPYRGEVFMLVALAGSSNPVAVPLGTPIMVHRRVSGGAVGTTTLDSALIT